MLIHDRLLTSRVERNKTVLMNRKTSGGSAENNIGRGLLPSAQFYTNNDRLSQNVECDTGPLAVLVPTHVSRILGSAPQEQLRQRNNS